jgi:hypothetical protein
MAWNYASWCFYIFFLWNYSNLMTCIDSVFFFCNFLIEYFLFLGLSRSNDPSCGFDKFSWVDFVYFFGFFYNWFFFSISPSNNSIYFYFFSQFFFQFHLLTLGCLGIEFRNFFLICFLLSYPDLMDLVFFFYRF